MSDRRLHARRATGLAGMLAALLFVAGNGLWALEQPSPGAPASQIVDFYTSASGRIVVGGSLSLFSVAFFVFFASGIRSILQEIDGDDLFASTAFGGALLLAAAGLGAEVINMVGAWRADDGSLTRELSRTLFEISCALGFNGAGAGLGILLGAIAASALRARALLPRWLALVLLVVACASFTPLSQFIVGPSALMLAYASARLRWFPAHPTA